MKNNINDIIIEIKDSLTTIFDKIDLWFDKEAELRSYKPKNGGWSIDEILEHIGLTNYFLLILIDKGTAKALNNTLNLDLEIELENYVFHRDKLTEVGLHKSFEWIRPEHMEPKGQKTLIEVRQQLKDQIKHCFNKLELLRNGEGVLYRTTMTVNELGKIDVYEYIFFLAQHGQ
jgi:hypothetical protein